MKKTEMEQLILDISKQIENNLDYSNFGSLIDYADLCYYLSFLDKENNELSSAYLKKTEKIIDMILQDIDKYWISYGAWNGFAQLVYTINAIRSEDEYRSAIKQIDEYLKSIIRKLFNKCDWRKTGNYTACYDAISGISGLGKYFLENSPYEVDIITEILQWIIDITLYAEDDSLLGYFIPFETTTNPLFKMMYPNGHIDYGLAHGIAGPLVLLSNAKKVGYTTHGIEDAIKRIQKSYFSYFKYKSGKPVFPSLIYKDKDGQLVPVYQERVSWCYGTIGIIRALYISAKDLNQKNEIEIIERAIEDLSKISIENYNLVCPTFCHGYSGLYHIFSLFQHDIEGFDLSNIIERLENLIWNLGNKENIYYFEKIDFDFLKNATLIDKNNISALDGVISIIISYIVANREIKKDFYSKLLFLS